MHNLSENKHLGLGPVLVVDKAWQVPAVLCSCVIHGRVKPVRRAWSGSAGGVLQGRKGQDSMRLLLNLMAGGRDSGDQEGG